MLDCGARRLRLAGADGMHELELHSCCTQKLTANRPHSGNPENSEKQLAQQALARMGEAIEQMGKPEAEVLVRPAPKHYKCYKNKRKLIPIKQMLRDLRKREETAAESQQKVVSDALNSITLLHVKVAPDHRCTTVDAARPRATYASASRIRHLRKQKGERWMELDLLPLAEKTGAPTYAKFEAWVDGAGRDCPPAIREVVLNNKSIFMDNLPPGLPPERVIDHTITLVPGKLPSKGAIYKVSPQEREEQRKILQELKDNKWITMTGSPFAAPSMLVTKKDDATGKQQYRMVINYKELNSLTISPEYPLPTIQEILDLLHGAKVFTLMDMAQGFHQIRVAPQDQYKTAFRTCMGQYEFKVMPFGLRGAPGTYQAIMNHMFFDYIGKGVIAYLDDLLVYAPSVQEHAALLDRVLKILKQYLGYTVGQDGIKPSKAKVDAILIWPDEMKDTTAVRQFLGLVNYCRMFMGPEYAILADPLNQLLKKDVPFVWTQRHTAAVQALRDRLANYTTLQVPDLSKPFILWTDASGIAVGAVLEQEGKPLAFMSLKMSPVEQRYGIYDQELLALVRALERWRRLLLATDVTAYTDHRGLEYLTQLKNSKPVRGRVARWLDFLADFVNLKIVYKPGKSNIIADALSRCPHYALIEPEVLPAARPPPDPGDTGDRS
ncbi:hypothetical protein Emed_007482 [Eimeria media]